MSSKIARIDDERKSVQSEIDATCHEIEKFKNGKAVKQSVTQFSKVLPEVN